MNKVEFKVLETTLHKMVMKKHFEYHLCPVCLRMVLLIEVLYDDEIPIISETVYDPIDCKDHIDYDLFFNKNAMLRIDMVKDGKPEIVGATLYLNNRLN